MTQKEKFDEMIQKALNAEEFSEFRFYAEMMSNMAESLAIIADRMTENAETYAARKRKELAEEISQTIKECEHWEDAYLPVTILCKKVADGRY